MHGQAERSYEDAAGNRLAVSAQIEVSTGLEPAGADWDLVANERRSAMKTFKATVRVRSASGNGMMVVWAQVSASDPNSARQMLEAQYGRGNVISIPTVVR